MSDESVDVPCDASGGEGVRCARRHGHDGPHMNEEAMQRVTHEIAVDALLDLIDDLTLSGECRYDHDDCCQEHFLHPRPCPHERAQKILAARSDHRREQK